MWRAMSVMITIINAQNKVNSTGDVLMDELRNGRKFMSDDLLWT
jgi:hypothetical protein